MSAQHSHDGDSCRAGGRQESAPTTRPYEPPTAQPLGHFAALTLQQSVGVFPVTYYDD